MEEEEEEEEKLDSRQRAERDIPKRSLERRSVCVCSPQAEGNAERVRETHRKTQKERDTERGLGGRTTERECVC